MVSDSEEKLIKELEKHGMQVTRPDAKEFKAAEKPLWDKYESVFWQRIYGFGQKIFLTVKCNRA